MFSKLGRMEGASPGQGLTWLSSFPKDPEVPHPVVGWWPVQQDHGVARACPVFPEQARVLQGSYGPTDRQTMAAQLTLVLRLSLVLLQLSQDTLTFPRLLTLRVTTLHGAREVFPGAGASPTQPGAAQPCDPCKACTAWVLG